MANENDNKLVTLADLGVAYDALDDSKVDIASITNNLSTQNEGKVLDARQGAILKALIDGTILIGPTTTIAAGTTTKTLTGLTGNHRVAYWGFSNGGENDPPADITVTTDTGSYTVVVTNVSISGATMTPAFIAPQN